MRPEHVWTARPEAAALHGKVLGDAGPTSPQRRLGDFRIPNRGLFVVGRATFDG